MSELEIFIEAPPTKATLDVIDKGLDVHNAKFSPEHFEEFATALKLPSGEVKGGIYALAWAEMLFIKWLWIDEAHRRGGHGRALMAAAEAEGRRRGCTAVWLDTFEFQARPFYEKLGYDCFATLDYPAGFKRFFMKKAL
ncbi:MAG: GNAT family N-acetyltransferase [Alphaproteobacteria bacterium]|nr:GNAT family N-acetyltransferase [Alphaproteobacteria bacterium]